VAGKQYYDHLHWRALNSPDLDDVAEYRLRDYANAMQEIHTLVEHVNSGDILSVINEGFSFPKDIDLVELWEASDGYHSRLQRHEPFEENR